MHRVFLALAALSSAAAIPDAAAADAAHAGVAAAHAALAADYDQVVAEVIELTEIPAPPFKEAARGARYAEKFRALGLKDVTIDAAGNVIGVRPGRDRRARALVVAAHLDTVFPEGTAIKVRRDGDTLHAPGIGDDTVSLAALLAFVRAMDAAKVQTKRDIIFVGDVGEEGPGDLRGMKALFSGPLKARIGDFVSFDGTGMDRVTNGAVGSKRYRVAFKGPGGHSYGAYGIVNPMVAMAGTVTALYAVPAPADVKTTYAASVVSGGTSVNSIPNTITAEFDMRSRSPANLAAVERRFLDAVAASVAAENAARNTRFGSVSAAPELIGDRPAGETPANDPLVRAAAGALLAAGYKADLEASSTDANLPISLDIPAITVSVGAGGGRAHALDEWVNVAQAPFVRGLQTGLDIVLAAAAIERR